MEVVLANMQARPRPDLHVQSNLRSSDHVIHSASRYQCGPTFQILAVVSDQVRSSCHGSYAWGQAIGHHDMHMILAKAWSLSHDPWPWSKSLQHMYRLEISV